jgi:hypothetical protein
VAALGDYDGDGRTDILWRNDVSGENYIYFMDGTAIANEGFTRTVADMNWDVVYGSPWPEPKPAAKLLAFIAEPVLDTTQGALELEASIDWGGRWSGQSSAGRHSNFTDFLTNLTRA